MPQIIVTIAPDGSTKVTAKGYTGPACRDATKALREALGQSVRESRTADYYAAVQQQAQQRLGGG